MSKFFICFLILLMPFTAFANGLSPIVTGEVDLDVMLTDGTNATDDAITNMGGLASGTIASMVADVASASLKALGFDAYVATEALQLLVDALPEYADNAAALTGGLTAGDVYKNTTDNTVSFVVAGD
jgi:hypothetical protein